MISLSKRLSLAVIGATFLISSLVSAGSVSGKWKWTIETPDGNSFKSVMEAKQTDSKLTGFLSRPESEDKLEIQKGKVDGDKVSFTVVPVFDGNEITVEYSGVLKGDKIDGNLLVVDFGAELEWHASRVTESVNPTGAWEWALETPNGNTIYATLELSLKNEKLTGELVSDNWAMELENAKIANNKLSFTTTNPNNDQKYLSTGTITGKKIKGEVTFTSDSGEENKLTWTATRQ